MFNLCHASAHNVVEWIFGILKQHFWILHNPPEYNMNIQALVPPVLTVLHNFIQEYNPEEIHGYDDLTIELQMGQQCEFVGELGTGQVMQDETV